MDVVAWLGLGVLLLCLWLVAGVVVGLVLSVFHGIKAVFRALWHCTDAALVNGRRFGWRLCALWYLIAGTVQFAVEGYEDVYDWSDDHVYEDGFTGFMQKMFHYPLRAALFLGLIAVSIPLCAAALVVQGGLLVFDLIITVIYLGIAALMVGIGIWIGCLVGGAVGVFMAFRQLCHGVWLEVSFKDRKWHKGDEPAMRNYFLGVGLRQWWAALKQSLFGVVFDFDDVWKVTRKLRGDDGLIGSFKSAGAIAANAVELVVQILLGLTVTIPFMLLCLVVLLVGGAVMGPIAFIAWAVERLYLKLSKVSADCPRCFSRYQTPYFRCPSCKAVHKRLLPGPYGVFTHRCTCGQKLPATYLGGRSKLESVCPNCNWSMVSTDSRPITFQMVGGRTVGKTAFVAAFATVAAAMFEKGGRQVGCPEEYRFRAKELERLYTGENNCTETTHRNAVVYPLTVEEEHAVPVQLSLYDVAGSMFSGTGGVNAIQQQQFGYCDGFLFVVDPLSSGSLRRKLISAGRNFSRYSNDPPENVAAVFISLLQHLRRTKATARFTTPLSVVISKADVPEVAEQIGDAAIRKAMADDPAAYPTYEDARDALCRQFLTEHDLSATVQTLELQFTNVHYFPVSATGGVRSGQKFCPVGVTEPVRWMLAGVDKDLAALLSETN